MTCQACTEAERDPTRDEFSNFCASCDARALAATGAHLASRAAGRMTPEYRDALGKVFGEAWREGHEAVREWAGKMQQGKARGAC